MRKLEGLRFLQEQFPKLTVDCLFVDENTRFKKENLCLKNETETIWRVRTGKRMGSELNTDQKTCQTEKEVEKFIKEQKKKDSNTQFVIHRVLPRYFSAIFVGSLAVYNNYHAPCIRIELQKVTQELVDAIDKGKRPRDWEPCMILDYELLYKVPKIGKKQEGLDMTFLKGPILELHKIGEKIFEFYERQDKVIDTYTRFNIYDNGQVLLDDHRSSDSFLQCYRYQVPDMNKQRQGKKEENKKEENTR